MIFFVPIVPILIAIVILVLSITMQIATAVNVITTIGWILVIILSISMVVSGFFSDTPWNKKIIGIILSVVSAILSFIESKSFLYGLATTNTSDICGLFEFLFVLIFGGLIWISGVGMLTYASFNATDDAEYDEPFRYIRSIGAIAGSCLLCGFFGFFS